MNAICPYCSAEVEPDPLNRVECQDCGAPHHRDCWEENGGCSVFGCTRAPGDEPAVRVAPAEVGVAPPPQLAPRAPYFSLLNLSEAPPIPSLPPAWPLPADDPQHRPKNRAVFVVLGVFLGIFGAHNFYARYPGRAIAQLCITLLTLFMGSIIVWLWAVLEVCMIDRDGSDVPMK